MNAELTNIVRVVRDLKLSLNQDNYNTLRIGDTYRYKGIGRKAFYFTYISPVIYNPVSFMPTKRVYVVYDNKKIRLTLPPEIYTEIDSCGPKSNIKPIVFHKKDINIKRALLTEKKIELKDFILIS